MKRLGILTLIVIVFSSTTSVAIAADPPLASCLSFRGETASISSYAISISVPVYQKCGKLVHWGDFALVTVNGDDGLLGAGKCDSFLLAQGSATLGEVYSGTINCTIVISGWQASKRVGETSSTLRVKYVWDFSSTSVTVRHPAIPAASSSSSGTSSGSSGGSGSSSQIIPTPNCSTTPDTPIVNYEYDAKGINFKVTPAKTGGNASRINWTYSLFDVATQKWGEWSPFTVVAPAVEFVKSFSTDPTKKYIGFDAYSSNDCGYSKLVWEIKDKIVLELTSTQVDEITIAQNLAAKIRVGQSSSLSSLANSKLKLKLSARSTSPSVCEVVSETLIKFVSGGDCTLIFTSITDGIKTAAPPTNILLKIYNPKLEQSIPDPNLKESYTLSQSNFELSLKSSAGLPVRFESGTDFSCSVIGDRIVFNDTGECMIFASQAGDEDTNMAITKDFTFWILENPKKKTTITCVKGKLTKKVTAISPKCPAGYKKK